MAFYQPTFEHLVSDSFNTYQNAYESLVVEKKSKLFTINIDVLFQSYVKLCTIIGGVFIFKNNNKISKNPGVNVGFFPFTNVEELMVGGDINRNNNIVKYEPSSSSISRFKTYTESKKVVHHKPYYIFMLITSCIFYFVMALSCMNLIGWMGGTALVNAKFRVMQQDLNLFKNQANAHIGPHFTSLNDRIEELLNHMPQNQEIYDTLGYEPMTTELSIESPQNNSPIWVLLKEINTNTTGKELGFVIPPTSDIENNNTAVIKNFDVTIGSIFSELEGAHEQYNSFSNRIDDIRQKALNVLSNIDSKKQQLITLSVALKKKVNELDTKKKYALNHKLETLGEILVSATQYIYKGLTFQERESPLQNNIEIISQMEGVLKVIGPTMAELSNKATIMNNGLSIVSNTMWLGVQIKFLIFTMISISLYFSYKLVKSLNEITRYNSINEDHKNLFMNNDVALTVFKQIVRGEVSDPGKFKH